jgi:putative flavoprotein involved in K+ transport
VARFVEGYAAFIRAPVRCDMRVSALRQEPGGERFLVESNDATIEAANVVVATGPYQRPAIPKLAAAMPPWVFQVHSSSYRNPGQLPPGTVLVVGSAASGCQIAEDLQESGRQVYLAVGSHRRSVRRHRGRDIIWWLIKMGRFDRTVETASPEARRTIAVTTGVNGGHDLDVWRLAANGVVPLGHLRGVGDGTCTFAADLEQTLIRADEACNDVLRSVDDYIEKTGLHAPEPDVSSPRHAVPTPTTTLDLRAAGIRSVVWATGFRDDFGWVHLPVFDHAGKPIHRRGVTRQTGLYFLGLSWLHKQKSALLIGAGEDAAYLSEHIVTRL